MTKRGKPGRPTREATAALNQEMLDVARELFSLKGYAGSSIDELSTRLSASKHTIYRRFPDKLAILSAVVERDIERFEQALVSAGNNAESHFVALRLMSKTYFAFSVSRSYSALYAAIFLEAATSPSVRQKLVSWAARSLSTLHRAVELASREREWINQDAKQLTYLLIDLLDGEASRLKIGEDLSEIGIDEAFDRRWAVFLKLV